MMLCDDCKKKPACVHLTKIVNNHKVEKHLCEECANIGESVHFMEAPGNFSVNDFLKGLFNHLVVDEPQEQSLTCSNCGMTYDDFSRRGKIGCSQCYTTFSARLEPLIRRIHGSSSHTGKVPKRSGGKLALKQKLKRLRLELSQFVEKEEYEKAATLRDEIRQLERDFNQEQEGEHGI